MDAPRHRRYTRSTTVKLARIALLLVLFLATAAVVWSALNLPPPLWIVKYGLAPGCEPEGEVTVEGVEFVVIGPGCSRMGSTRNGKPGTLPGRFCGPVGVDWGVPPEPSDEMPVHWCEFPNGFALARTEVTNAQYERFDPTHPRDELSDRDTDPVASMSWEAANAYCAWLEKRAGRPVRLPTESEWEAACRAGSESEYCFGDDAARLGDFAWYFANSAGRAHEVATKKPNAWGFYDLHGNVWEWCEDLYHESYRSKETVPGPDGRLQVRVVSRAPTDGSAWLFESGSLYRVSRGGGWSFTPEGCRSAGRYGDHPGGRGSLLGFRPALGN